MIAEMNEKPAVQVPLTHLKDSKGKSFGKTGKTV